MESVNTLLDCVLSEESLNNLIQTTRCLELLNYLLRVKYSRVLSHQCEKFNFDITCIYDTNINCDTGAQILETTLLIAEDPNTHLVTTKKYCLDRFQLTRSVNELQYVFNLFNIVLEYYKKEHKLISFTVDDINQLHEGILTVLKGSSKPLITFILINIIPNYLNVSSKECHERLLTEIFNYVKESKKLDILCMSFDKFITNDTFSLMNRDDFWSLLTDCVSTNHFLQKQAAYLLSKCVQIATKAPDLVPNYLKTENKEIGNVWRHYLTLLDISNEKQLHIIEPSLCMFNSIQSLHFEWRLCLYKVFLKHSQNTVVYYVALFILENETEWTVVSKIIREFLASINKNEYNSESQAVFKKLGKMCAQLNETQFHNLLEESLNVAWVPAAIWGFFSNIFETPVNCISLSLLESVLMKLKQIPHKFIRDGCVVVVLNYFVANYKFDSLRNFLKISLLLYSFDKNMFIGFIRRCEGRIRTYSDELYEYFLKCEDLKEVEIVLEILHFLRLDIHTPAHCCNKSDLTYLFLLSQNYNVTDLEQYLLKRVDSVNNGEDVTTLLSLIQTFSTTPLIEKSLEIVSKKNIANCNTAQKIVAFNVISKHKGDTLKYLIDSCKTTTDEQLSHIFVQTLSKYLAHSHCHASELNEFIGVLENILDSQSKATVTIFENMIIFLTYVDQDTVFHFIKRCFDEFLIVCKSGCSRTTTDSFLAQIFVPDLLENVGFSKELLSFSQQLLDIANNATAYVLCKKIANLIRQSPQKGTLFISTIVDLILRGTVVSKTEKVEYCVCQEISTSLHVAENNPNIMEVSTRLCAFDSMMTLVNKQPDTADIFVSLLLEKYMKYFSKRYFPDSQIHLQKLRILQALILLRDHVKTQKLIDFITESFLEENHQPSIKHLMQWLLISLVRNDNTFILNMTEKLKTIDNNRPSTVSGFIPVIYHLMTYQDESQWDQFVEVLLIYTMGAQFKLRIFSQVALLKLYEKAANLRHSRFVEKYDFLYNSLKQVVEATSNAESIHHEFLDYFSLEDYKCSTIFYTVPKLNGVTCTEWENLYKTFDTKQMDYIRFDHIVHDNESGIETQKEAQKVPINVQKKVTPWKDMFDNLGSDQCTNNFILITSLIEKPANLGGLSRTCEVFGIKQMVMRTSKVVADKEFKSLSMSSENWVDITEVKVENLQSFIIEIRKQGYSVIGAEQTSESVKLDEFQFPKRMALLLGNEKEGIPPNLIPLLETCIEIPQFGMVRSLNVHVAGAIVMWEYCKQQKL